MTALRRRLLMDDAPAAWVGRAVVVLLGLAFVCAGLVLLASFGFGTSRAWGPDPALGNAGSGMREGAGRWAGWTFVSGLAALGALLVATNFALGGHRALSGLTTAPAVPPFVAAALVGGHHWLRLLDESQRNRDYVLTIAPGLPVVTLAAFAGAFLATTAAVLLLSHRPTDLHP